MRCSRWRRVAVAFLALAVLMGLAVSVQAPPPDHPAVRLLASARKAIRSGSAAEAAKPLEDVKRLFPQTPEADEAEKLLKRISSLEVLLDRSHEWRSETQTVAGYLKQSGIGVTTSDASLAHLKDRLGDYEVILIWQEQATLAFTESEIQMLKDYLKEGGRLLVIGTTKTPAPYPLRKLLDALGCPLRAPQAQVNYGEGRVKFFDNTGLFVETRLADARESQQEVVEVFQRMMPYEQLGRSSVDEYVKPETEEQVGPLKLEYSARLTTSAERTTELLTKILEQISLAYKDDLAEGMTVRLVPRGWSSWMGNLVFGSGALQTPPDLTRQLSRAVALYALFPEGKWIDYPPWITNGWCDLVALRVCYKVGFKRESETMRKEYLDAYKPDLTKLDDIDLSVSQRGGQREYIAKAQWVLEVLEKNQNKNILASLRRTLKRYAAAGKVPDAMSTRNVLFYLSQALHQDMFAFFQAVGTNVLPVKLDYYELDKPEKK